MKQLTSVAAIIATVLSSGSAWAVAPVGQNYTFLFSGNCQDCADAAETEGYAVQASLQVTNYVLGDALQDANFVQFDYGGSNLFPAYTIGSAIFGGLSGAIGAAPGFYDVQIFGYPFYFSSSSEGSWQTGLPTFAPADYGDGGTWAVAAPTAGVPEPATWATMILGFAVAGAAMRRRTRVRYSFG